jgi:hypothetical protein
VKFSKTRERTLQDKFCEIYLNLLAEEYSQRPYEPLEARQKFFDRVFAAKLVNTERDYFLLGTLAESAFRILPEALEITVQEYDKEAG